MAHKSPTTNNPTLRRVELPRLEPPSDTEIERRRILFARAMALRAEIGPIGIRTELLIHQAREEADAGDR
jgi:hypothetical protein